MLREPVKLAGIRDDRRRGHGVHATVLELEEDVGEVQRQVADAVDKMLGLEVRQVNVFVGDVRFPEDG